MLTELTLTVSASFNFRLPKPEPDVQVIFGNWSILAAVDVSQISVTNTVVFHVGYSLVISSISVPSSVQRLSSLPVNVTLTRYGSLTQGLTLTVSLMDSAQVPLGTSTVSINTQAQGNITVSTSIPIPSWAFIGQSTVYVNVLTTAPDLGGTPSCPQATAHFQIV